MPKLGGGAGDARRDIRAQGFGKETFIDTYLQRGVAGGGRRFPALAWRGGCPPLDAACDAWALSEVMLRHLVVSLSCGAFI